MLKVNVGLSKKLSKDYNSTGFSVNLEGEITASPSDSDAIIEQVKELFDLAEESLDQQIERCQSIDSQASRDRESPPASNAHQHRSPNGNGNDRQTNYDNGRQHQNGRHSDERRDEPATNKQIQYLLSIGKRQRLSTIQLEHQVREILRRQVGIYDLSKREAASVIDALTKAEPAIRQDARY